MPEKFWYTCLREKKEKKNEIWVYMHCNNETKAYFEMLLDWSINMNFYKQHPQLTIV